MAFFKVAMVQRSDYARLRSLIPELPQEFDQWKLMQDFKAAQHQGSGHHVELVEFNPSVFAEWCYVSRLSLSETSLDSWISAGRPEALK
jgi:hypothetical protein